MKSLVLLVGLVLINALSANGFLFGTKAPKDGCNPNPCKHGDCVKDALDAKKPGTCKCKTGYYGVKCENKDGCYSKPCKYGTCVVDSKDLSKFKCICPPGQVGEKCDKTDECAKNPCQNGGTCKLDAKLKAACTCTNGWSSKHCDKRNCTIVEFKGKHFSKLPRVYIDQSMLAKFKEIDEIAGKCKVTVQPSTSFSFQSGSLVAEYAPHYIGRGLTFELNDDNGRVLCNSLCLKRIPIPQKPAKCFIDDIVAKGWKFNPITHQIHDNTFVSNPTLYKTLRETAQVGCKDKNF